MFQTHEVLTLLRDTGVSHVVSVADSTIGAWAEAIDASNDIALVRVCREGEAWAIAGGLYLGGATPLVLIQCTGFFESGDALRNIIHDWRLPIYSMIGYRSYLDQSTIPGDTCLVFTEPLLDAWRLPYLLVTSPAQLDEVRAHMLDARGRNVPGVSLLAEGKA